MFKKYFILILLFSLALIHPSIAQKKSIAITIDDLPFVGEYKNFHLNMIIDAIKAHEIPATGFIIAGDIKPENWKVLRKFREAGLGLGNHTLSHTNLNQVNAETYIQEIDEADKILLPILTEPKYFRYPYLVMGAGNKKDKVLHFLSEKNYQVAPVTIDSKDFIFNQLLLSVPEKARWSFLNVLKPCYLNFIWQQTLQAQEKNPGTHPQTQILLIHANLLNAYVLPDIINLYKHNGFTFVSLEEALETFADNASANPHQTPKSKDDSSKEMFMAWDKGVSLT